MVGGIRFTTFGPITKSFFWGKPSYDPFSLQYSLASTYRNASIVAMLRAHNLCSRHGISFRKTSAHKIIV